MSNKLKNEMFRISDSERHSTNNYRKIDSFYFSKCLKILRSKNLKSGKASIIWDELKMPSRLCDEYLEVAYKIQNEKIHDKIIFSHIQNNFGGTDRVYFICPNCDRRTRFLYLLNPCFKCRECAGLLYDSQLKMKNIETEAAKVMDFLVTKLRDTPDVSLSSMGRYKPLRPKGMHRVTYERLLVGLGELQAEFRWEYNKRLKRLKLDDLIDVD